MVASALVAESLVDAPGSNPGAQLACRFDSCRAHFVMSSVRDGIWETCRIQTPVPNEGVQVRLLPDVHHCGSLVKSCITLGFYPRVPGSSPGRPTFDTRR